MTDAETVPSRQEQSIAGVIAGRCSLGLGGTRGREESERGRHSQCAGGRETSGTDTDTQEQAVTVIGRGTACLQQYESVQAI